MEDELKNIYISNIRSCKACVDCPDYKYVLVYIFLYIKILFLTNVMLPFS